MARFLAVLALLFASSGCAGRASVGSADSAGAPAQVEPSAGSPGSAGGSTGMPPSPPACTGTLEELNALTDAKCPSDWCTALGWASGCDGLPADVSQTSTSECESRTIELEFTSGERKRCYYSGTAISAVLATIELSSSTPSYCNGSAAHVASGTTPTSCSFQPTLRCTGTERRLGGGPAPICHDSFSNSCGVCCPSDPVDCTNKADGYPNGGCVASDNSFCSCTCQSGQWSCAC